MGAPMQGEIKKMIKGGEEKLSIKSFSHFSFFWSVYFRSHVTVILYILKLQGGCKYKIYNMTTSCHIDLIVASCHIVYPPSNFKIYNMTLR